MCRNITTLRGLEPPATEEEIQAAAVQYIRKVSGMRVATPANQVAFDEAVDTVAHATSALLGSLPPRKQPPANLPPLRRMASRSSIPPIELSSNG